MYMNEVYDGWPDVPLERWPTSLWLMPWWNESWGAEYSIKSRYGKYGEESGIATLFGDQFNHLYQTFLHSELLPPNVRPSPNSTQLTEAVFLSGQTACSALAGPRTRPPEKPKPKKPPWPDWLTRLFNVCSAWRIRRRPITGKRVSSASTRERPS